jgi:hypothetical protein
MTTQEYDYVNATLSKYPYRDKHGVPFRLERIDEHSWNVFECLIDVEYGHCVGFREVQADFDGCETLDQAVDYWTKYQDV